MKSDWSKILSRYIDSNWFVDLSLLLSWVKNKEVKIKKNCTIDEETFQELFTMSWKTGYFHKTDHYISIISTKNKNTFYNISTSSYLDSDWYDFFWYNARGYNKEWFNENWYNNEGYDESGYDIEWFNRAGFSEVWSYNKEKDTIFKKWENNPQIEEINEILYGNSNMIFLTGKAGTGKTTLMKDLIEHLIAWKNPPLVLASTGIASINIWWQTVHSFFSVPINQAELNNANVNMRDARIQTLKKCSMVIIDEISMLHANIIDHLDRKMQYVLKSNRPFWGKKMLFVGDVFQLPPIKSTHQSEGLNLYASELFFDALCIGGGLKIINLETNYRQESDRAFGNILDKVRNGTYTEDDLILINKRYSQTHVPWENELLLTTTNQVADEFNDKKLDEIQSEEFIYYSETLGNFPDKWKKVSDRLVLKEWTQIMVVNNDPKSGLVNGDIWIVKQLDEDGVTIVVKGKTYYIEKYKWENKETVIVDATIELKTPTWETTKEKVKKLEETILGSYVQFPLKLAWAITIHKSQWLTFDTCTIDIGNWAFADGQMYVALSRCKNLNGLTLKKQIRSTDIKVNQRAVDFMDS